MDIREELCEYYGDDLMFADGYDDAIIGVCGGFDSGRVAYSIEKMTDIAWITMRLLNGLSIIPLVRSLVNTPQYTYIALSF